MVSKDIETELGRRTKGDLKPRPIDIDILFYGNRVMNKKDLRLPHPGIASRGFVLTPLSEIAESFKHPVTGKRVGSVLSGFKNGFKVSLYRDKK